jgi:hypothetical protein
MLQFQPTVTIADIIDAILLVLALVGIFLTFKQIKYNDKTQKAAFFKDLYSTIFTDPRWHISAMALRGFIRTRRS